jgi:hypothetical protein
MPRRNQSVINLDPIHQKYGNDDGVLAKLVKTRFGGGASIKNNLPFGLYIFCGQQGGGKTLSAIWYYERLRRMYEKKGFKVNIWSNTPIDCKYTPVNFSNVYNTIYDINEKNEDINIFILDELQVYFPRDTKDKNKLFTISQMLDVMGQLRKRRVFILGVAQIFGRVDKSFREQALYMVNCRKNWSKRKLVNEFINAKDILCDDLGRWSGHSTVIWRHGLPKTRFNTRFIIRA